MVRSLILFTFFFVFSSCASKKEGSGGIDSSTSKAPEGDINKFSQGFKMVKDEETGMMRNVSDKKNPFGGESNPFSGTDSATKKEFSTAEFDSRRWSGTKSKSTKEWNGADKSYQYSPEFIRQNSSYADNYARESGSSYDAGSSSYQSDAAREQSGDRISRDLNYSVEKRRSVYVPPKIIDKDKQQGHSGRSVDDVKGLLND